MTMNLKPEIQTIGAQAFATDAFLSSLEVPLQQLYLFETIDSTNEFAKTLLNKQEKTLIVSETQFAGKGTNQRSFLSPKGGLYFSLLFFPRLLATSLQYLTIIAGVATVEAIMSESHNQIMPDIKWLNDIYLNQKKIGGILVEAKIIEQQYEHIILGIGLNLGTIDLPDELQKTVTSIENESQIRLQKETLLAKILNNFENYYQALLQNDMTFMERYRSYNFLLGKSLYHPEKEESIKIKHINQLGHLVIEKNGQEEILQVGNASLQGYIIK